MKVWNVIGIALLVLGGLGCCATPPPDEGDDNIPPRMTVADLLKAPQEYEGHRIRVLTYRGVREGEEKSKTPPFYTEKDIYLHDETGTCVLINAEKLAEKYAKLAEYDPNGMWGNSNMFVWKGRWDVKAYPYFIDGKLILSTRRLDRDKDLARPLAEAQQKAVMARRAQKAKDREKRDKKEKSKSVSKKENSKPTNAEGGK